LQYPTINLPLLIISILYHLFKLIKINVFHLIHILLTTRELINFNTYLSYYKKFKEKQDLTLVLLKKYISDYCLMAKDSHIHKTA